MDKQYYGLFMAIQLVAEVVLWWCYDFLSNKWLHLFMTLLRESREDISQYVLNHMKRENNSSPRISDNMGGKYLL